MHILITGASGFIGDHLVNALLCANHKIIVCARHPQYIRQRWPEVAVTKADFTIDHTAADWMPRLKDIDLVINTVGIIRENRTQTFDALHISAPIALFQACESMGIRRVIQISALGANEKAFSRYHKSKYAADQYLRGSALDWAVVMPSIVYGPGAKSMALFKALAALPFIPLIDTGDQCIQPVHINDLTKAIVKLVNSPTQLRSTIEIVGPAPITLKTLYATLRNWLGQGQARFLFIPNQLALLGARWSERLANTPITEESVQMLRSGNTGNVGPFITQFGFKPRSIEQALKETPAQQADYWHAKLYFLASTLRFMIAFVWIFTGFVSAFVYPIELSYAMLSKIGIEGIWQPLMLYSAAAMDMLLGIATLFAFRLRMIVALQISIILLYSVIITLWLPEQWMHPFGAISKNLPLTIATLIMLVLEGEKRWNMH